jgi:Tol biopolymer transport system component
MNSNLATKMVVLTAFLAGCASMGKPPQGAEAQLSSDENAGLARIRQKVDGSIVWSSSRFGNHDILLMKTDGTGVKALTSGEEVDWYPRFSPDGKQILFVRSKKGWVSEKDANRPEKWDQVVMDRDGGNLHKVAADASWGTWVDGQRILIARKTSLFIKDLGTGAETLLLDANAAPDLAGAELQNPHLSPDEKFVALTLRGSKRETGIYSLDGKTWVKTGEGCQINWFPQGDRILWVNPSGNGDSEVLAEPIKNGAPASVLSLEQTRFVDIPGRRSHEYFPQLDRSGKWLVWAATQRGHDHDIADYEIYIWEVGAPPDRATRLTFHSANDRWPDIFIP